MRIVFATHAWDPVIGGAERYARQLAEGFAGMGHEVHAIVPNRSSAEAFYEYGHQEAGPREEHLNGVHVHRIPLDPAWSWSLKPKGTIRPMPVAKAHLMWRRYATVLAHDIDELAPDATITLPHAFPNIPAALDASGRGIAVYAPLLHEEDPAWRISPIAELVAKSDVVLAMTKWERERLIDAYGAGTERTLVAPPSVDAPDPDTVPRVVSDTPYVVAIGRRTVSKELLTTASAVDKLNTDGIPIRFVIAGPGDDPDLDRELQSFGSFIEIIGTVPEFEKWGLIKGAVASVSMSVAESFGIGIAESWAMRRPAIARRVPSISSVVDDGIDGLLVDTEHDLAAAIKTLLTDPEVASRMGAAGEPKALRKGKSSASILESALLTVLP